MKFTWNGVTPDPSKVDTLCYAPRPQAKDEVWSFSSMVEANAEFIPYFSTTTCHLQCLYKNDASLVGLKNMHISLMH